MENENSTWRTEDDGLYMQKIGPWSVSKHRKVAYYASLFSKSMIKKWDCRVYVDLFAGAGKCHVKNTKQIVPGSPLLSLDVEAPFDKYVFCEQSEDSISALQQRVATHFNDRNVSFVHGDCNECLDAIFQSIPPFSSKYKGLTLCFVDPYKMGELKFETLATIARKLYVDFLVLIPSYMDINRNIDKYTQPDCYTLDAYLGSDDWRHGWRDPNRRISQFGVFIADCFARQMANLGYIYNGSDDMDIVKMEGANNLRLYHLAFFSKNKLGMKFWQETKKSTNDQLRLL